MLKAASQEQGSAPRWQTDEARLTLLLIAFLQSWSLADATERSREGVLVGKRPWLPVGGVETWP